VLNFSRQTTGWAYMYFAKVMTWPSSYSDSVILTTECLPSAGVGCMHDRCVRQPLQWIDDWRVGWLLPVALSELRRRGAIDLRFTPAVRQQLLTYDTTRQLLVLSGVSSQRNSRNATNASNVRNATNATHVRNASSSQQEPSCPLSSWAQVLKV